MLHTSHYVIHPSLNEAKVFACTPPPELDLTSLPLLADDWLEQLATISGVDSVAFTKHIGEQATYSLKKELLHALQLIFYRLNGQLDVQLGCLSHDEHKQFVLKLTEDLDACTPGFHNRVNDLVSAFASPSNLAELLYLVRKALFLVSPDADVHSWNRVSLVASHTGLGIKPNLEHDAYQGLLSDQQIQDYLQQQIAQRFTPEQLPALLTDQFKGLIYAYGYIGQADESGYTVGFVDQVFATISQFVRESGQKDEAKWRYFKIDEETLRIRDINWPLIESCFSITLSQEEYILIRPTTLQQLLTAYQQGLYEHAMVSELSLRIMCYSIADKPEQLIEEITAIAQQNPQFYAQFLQKPYEQLEYGESSVVWFDKIKRPTALLNSVSYAPEKARGLLRFLEINKVLIGKDLIKTLVLQTGENRVNSLILAARCHPEVVQALLQFLRRHYEFLGANFLREVLTQKNNSNWNALMVAACYQPQSVHVFLQFLENNYQTLGCDLINEMLMHKDENNWNALMLMAWHQPAAAREFLQFLSRHALMLGYDAINELLTQKTQNNWNALMLATYVHSETTVEFLNFLGSLHQFLGSELINDMLMQTTENKRNALMLAARHRPEAVSVFLQFLNSHYKVLGNKVLQALFMQQDDSNCNALMLATDYYPEVAEQFLQFFSDCHKVLGSVFLKEMLNQPAWNPLYNVLGLNLKEKYDECGDCEVANSRVVRIETTADAHQMIKEKRAAWREYHQLEKKINQTKPKKLAEAQGEHLTLYMDTPQYRRYCLFGSKDIKEITPEDIEASYDDSRKARSL